jgi:hypothetical protein
VKCITSGTRLAGPSRAAISAHTRWRPVAVWCDLHCLACRRIVINTASGRPLIAKTLLLREGVFDDILVGSVRSQGRLWRLRQARGCDCLAGRTTSEGCFAARLRDAKHYFLCKAVSGYHRPLGADVVGSPKAVDRGGFQCLCAMP